MTLSLPAITAAAATLSLVAAMPASAEQQRSQAFTKSAEDGSLEWGACPDYMPEGCSIAVLQGDPAEHNADIVFRLPAGQSAPRHWHTSAERMVLIRGEMEVDYDGQDPVVLSPGSYAYGPPKLPHTATCLSTEDCLLFIAFEDPVDAIEGEPD